MKITITPVHVDEFHMVYARGVVAAADFVDVLVTKVQKIVEENHLDGGELIEIYHEMEINPESTDMEAGIIVKEPNELTRAMPGGTYIKGVHIGSYDGLDDAHAQMKEWMAENHWTPDGLWYYRFPNSPEDTPEADLITEIYYAAHQE